MAQEALMWPNEQPVLVTRNEKVLRLLQAGDVGWGVTEAQSAFVYPHSLRPLRKIAGVQAESPSENGMNVSDVLHRAFPEENTDCDGDVERNSRGVEAEISKEGTAKQETQQEPRGGEGRGTTRRARSAERDDAIPREAQREATPKPESRRGKSAEPRDIRGRGSMALISGRPKFHTYGNGNTAPPSGGVVYGGYMLSHSIYPQVLPNRPSTRQVHPETERVALQAASKARASGAGSLRRTRRRQPQPPPCSPSPHTGGGGCGPSSPRASVLEAERQPNESSDNIPLDPVLNFRARARDPNSRRRARSRGVVGAVAGRANSTEQVDEDEASPCLPRTAAAETDPARRGAEEEELPSLDVQPIEAQASAVPPRPPSPPEAEAGDRRTRAAHDDPEKAKSTRDSRGFAARPQAWTVDQRLANDPRNYKLLPRGWEQELITPAGISGPIASPGEALLLRDGGACRWIEDKSSYRRPSSPLDDAGVRGCLRWNPGS